VDEVSYFAIHTNASVIINGARQGCTAATAAAAVAALMGGGAEASSGGAGLVCRAGDMGSSGCPSPLQLGIVRGVPTIKSSPEEGVFPFGPPPSSLCCPLHSKILQDRLLRLS
jgi:hypothetical protein